MSLDKVADRLLDEGLDGRIFVERDLMQGAALALCGADEDLDAVVFLRGPLPSRGSGRRRLWRGRWQVRRLRSGRRRRSAWFGRQARG